MPNFYAWTTPNDWCFGFGFCFPAESKLPLGGWFIKSPADIYLCIGPLTVGIEFGEREMLTRDIEDIREESRDKLQGKHSSYIGSIVLDEDGNMAWDKSTPPYEPDR